MTRWLLSLAVSAAILLSCPRAGAQPASGQFRISSGGGAGIRQTANELKLGQLGDFPPAPGPGFDMEGRDLPRGEDPTEDKLGCEAGGEC